MPDMVQWQLLYELWHKTRLLEGKKTPDVSKVIEARVAVLEAKTENSTNESLFSDKKPKANNKNDPAIDRNGSRTRKSQPDTWWLVLSKEDSQPSELTESFIKPLATVHAKVAHASVASSKPKKGS